MMQAIAMLTFMAVAGAGWNPPTLAERAIVEHALRHSPLTIERYRDPWLLLEVLRMETHPEIDVPEEFAGSFLAVSYRESVWKTDAVGDGGRAHGWSQMHRWHHKVCNNFDRSNPIGNMRCWGWRVRTTYERKVRRKCQRQGHSDSDAWIAAWRWVARGGKFPGCQRGSARLHLRQLQCWKQGWYWRQLPDGQRKRVVCKRGRHGGWTGEIARYVRRRYGDESCNPVLEHTAWGVYE